MCIIDRYIFRLLSMAFLAALGVLTGVVWITQALRQVDLLTTKGQTLLIFFTLSGLTIPSLIVIIAPIAMFIATLWVFHRLNADSELIVMSASGITPMVLLRPCLALILIVSLCLGSLSLWGMPASFRMIRQLIVSIESDFLTQIVKPGTFTEISPDLIFHYREKGPKGTLMGLFIQDRRDPARVSTYLAELGRADTANDQSFLVLEKGHIQRQTDKSRDPAMIVFDKYAIDLSQVNGAPDNVTTLRPRERATSALLWPNMDETFVQKNMPLLRAELHDRFAMPLWVLALGLLGAAAMLTPCTTRQKRGMAIGGVIVLTFMLRAMGFWASALSTKYDVGILLMYLIPLVGAATSLFYALNSSSFWPIMRPVAVRRGG